MFLVWSHLHQLLAKKPPQGWWNRWLHCKRAKNILPMEIIMFSWWSQWPFQEPKLEVPTIYKAYVREYPHKICPYMVQDSTSILGSWNSHWWISFENHHFSASNAMKSSEISWWNSHMEIAEKVLGCPGGSQITRGRNGAPGMGGEVRREKIDGRYGNS